MSRKGYQFGSDTCVQGWEWHGDRRDFRGWRFWIPQKDSPDSKDEAVDVTIWPVQFYGIEGIMQTRGAREDRGEGEEPSVSKPPYCPLPIPSLKIEKS